jgi:type III secretion protein T
LVVQNVGVFIDHQRGGASLMVNDPTIQNQTSPIGTLLNMMLIVIFYGVGGPFLFVEAIMNSYDILPADKLLNDQFFAKGSKFWEIQINLLNEMMILSVQLCSPALIMILMTDVFLGIANRLAPQVQITFLGMPLKSFLALLVLWVGWKALTDQLVIEMHSAMLQINDAIASLSVIKRSP